MVDPRRSWMVTMYTWLERKSKFGEQAYSGRLNASGSQLSNRCHVYD